MKIDCIYIGCHKGDIRFTRVLVASIRNWHSDIKISLIKDESSGKFDTTDIERSGNVSLLQGLTTTGSLSKLEAMSFDSSRKRILYLDSDIAFLGPLLETLECYDEDFIVAEQDFTPEQWNGLFFNMNRMQQFDPLFFPAEFRFNSGQIVFTSGIIKKADYQELIVRRGNSYVKRFPDVFYLRDQGIINYIILKKLACSEITVRRVPFRLRGTMSSLAGIQLNTLNKEGYCGVLVHWSGEKPPHIRLRNFPGKEIFLFFEKKYYKNIFLGTLLRVLRSVWYLLQEN